MKGIIKGFQSIELVKGKFSHNAHKHCLWLCLQARAFKPGSALNLRVIQHVRDHGTA
jgi:hypothetical protein